LSVAPRQRLDKWLFFARAMKSRTLAQRLIESGAVRVNAERTLDCDRQVGAGDVLTIALGRRLIVWRIREAGTRRGPATEAALLYEDLSPQLAPGAMAGPVAVRVSGTGRPAKKQRRDIDGLRRQDIDEES
jgi:ribosome-associated heat shock protein Hsp15